MPDTHRQTVTGRRATSAAAGFVRSRPPRGLTYELRDAAAAAAARGLGPGGRELRQAAGRGQRLQELRGRRPEQLLQQLQGPGHDVVVLVLRVPQRQLVHLQTGHAGGRSGF